MPWRARIAGRSDACARTRAADQALFGIVQGGVDAELRRESVAAVAALAVRRDRHRRPLGGGDEGGDGDARSTWWPMRWASDARVRYLMGVGSPVDFFTGVERGIDLFDCVLPTRVARNGQLWTSGGKLNLRNARFPDDPSPVDAACSCETCRNHSRAYLAHLFRAEELLAYRLASLHNVTYTLDLMRRIRGALADGTFGSLRDVVTERVRKHGRGRG